MDKVRTRLLILSDTHGSMPQWVSTVNDKLQADVAIHCGDLTSTGKISEHQSAFNLVKSLPAPLKIVIAGNHDLTLEQEYCRTHKRLYHWKEDVTAADLEAALDIYTSKEARRHGIVYLTEGRTLFTLANGARLSIYVSPYTPEFWDWGFAYPRSSDRFNAGPNKVPEHTSDASECVAVIITHGPPMGILDRTSHGDSVGCKHLKSATARCKPLLHCFAHIHEAWGMVAEQWGTGHLEELYSLETLSSGALPVYHDMTNLVEGRETVFVNASIMDQQYFPVQKPFLIDVMLPLSLVEPFRS